MFPQTVEERIDIHSDMHIYKCIWENTLPQLFLSWLGTWVYVCEFKSQYVALKKSKERNGQTQYVQHC